MTEAERLIDRIYNSLDGFEDMGCYHARHKTRSLQILTQCNPFIAAETVKSLEVEIWDKIVVEIGAGVGFLAIEMAKHAKFVWAIEVEPMWSWVFARSLYKCKPTNLTWIFGDARSVIGKIRGDVAVVVTNSDIEGLQRVARCLADKVIMPKLRRELDKW